VFALLVPSCCDKSGTCHHLVTRLMTHLRIKLYCLATRVKTLKLLQICKQVVTRLLLSRYQDVFALLVPSCCVWNKLLSSCYKVDDGNRLATSCSSLFVTSYYELVVINLSTPCYVQTISDSLEQVCWPHQPCYKMIDDVTTCSARYLRVYTT
jgi:hypothetical protein